MLNGRRSIDGGRGRGSHDKNFAQSSGLDKKIREEHLLNDESKLIGDSSSRDDLSICGGGWCWAVVNTLTGMTLSLLALAFGTAAAFAPASKGPTTTGLNAVRSRKRGRFLMSVCLSVVGDYSDEDFIEERKEREVTC